MIVLVTRDLFFASKVTGTAQQLGIAAVSVDSVPALHERIVAGDVTGIVLDLGSGILAAEIASAAASASPRPKVIGFGAHVETSALDAARAAGFDDVMPRSRFSSTLPSILQELAPAS
jgi:hypothetical protein